jgi:hypothetical protein
VSQKASVISFSKLIQLEYRAYKRIIFPVSLLSNVTGPMDHKVLYAQKKESLVK